MASTKKSKMSIHPCFFGQAFFIAPSACKLDHVVNNIVLLGGKIEVFFHRDVTSLIVDDMYITQYNAFVRSYQPVCVQPEETEKFSDVRTLHAGKSYIDTTRAMSSCSSRAYSLLLTSAAKQKAYFNENQNFKLIQRAKEWGITITGLQQLILYMEGQMGTTINPRKRKQICQKIELAGCLIKIEDVAKKFKTFYKIFDDDPLKYLPVQAMQLVSTHFKPKTMKIGNEASKYSPSKIVHSAKDKKVNGLINTPKALPKNKKKQNHYCECCNICFSDFMHHILGEKHQSFCSNERNYDCVKEIINTLPTLCEFIKSHNSPVSKDAPLDFSMPKIKPPSSEDSKSTAPSFTQTMATTNFCEDSPMASLNPPSNKALFSQFVSDSNPLGEGNCLPSHSSFVDVVNIKSENVPMKFELDFDFIDFKSEEESVHLKEECDKEFNEFSQYCQMLVSQTQNVRSDVKNTPLEAGNDPCHSEVKRHFQSVSAKRRVTSSTSSIKLEKLNIGQIGEDTCDRTPAETNLQNATGHTVSFKNFITKAIRTASPSSKYKGSDKEEKMFSSDNSDRGGQSAFINNVLTIINNSENESKLQKPSVEQQTPLSNRVQGKNRKEVFQSNTKSTRRVNPVWSVQIVPSNSIRLRFTCIQQRTTAEFSMSSSSSSDSSLYHQESVDRESDVL